MDCQDMLRYMPITSLISYYYYYLLSVLCVCVCVWGVGGWAALEIFLQL